MACNGFCNAVPGVFRPRFSALVPAINEVGGSAVNAIAAINEQIGTEDWIRITPFGEFPNSVGLQVVDRAAGERMVSAFNTVSTKLATLFRGLPVFEGHPDDPEWRKQNPGVRAVAVGRVKEMQLREDGVWGRVAWNERGTALVRGDAPAYTAQSPHWGMLPRAPRKFTPVEILSLGLTNQPNIPGTDLGINEAETAAANTSAMKAQLIALLAALGRPVSNPSAVSDEQLVTAANEALPVATQLVAASTELPTVKGQLTSAQASLTTASNEAATLRTQLAAERSARAELVVTTAINEGRITVAQKPEWLGKFTAANADFAAVTGELGKLKKAVNTRSQLGDIGARKQEGESDNSKLRAINEAVAAKTKSGVAYHDAYMAVKAEKPELFTADKAAE